MNPAIPSSDDRDAGLWLACGGVAVALHLAVLLIFAFTSVASWFVMTPPPSAVPDKAEEAPLVILPIVPKPAEAPTAAPEPKRFARTSPDQAGPAPEDAPFIGERDTQAAGDAAPVRGADPDLASQKGVQPKAGEIETTRSDYQDGDLASQDMGSQAADPAPVEPVREEPVETEQLAAQAPPAQSKDPSKDVLAAGPDPIDVASRQEIPVESQETPEKKIEEMPKERPTEATSESRPKPKPTAPPSTPGFRGNQQPTQLSGSISRSGNPALDVKSGPLGKYHAALSRAIEKSWQRQVVRNRDYITPGVLRIRVVLDPEGRVRSVGTVDEVGVNVIQRGFTHTSIREAELPSMPAEVRKELAGEPLELLYNFIF